MKVQEIKIDGITYVINENSTLCSNCALAGKDCDIVIGDIEYAVCEVLFDNYALKVKED